MLKTCLTLLLGLTIAAGAGCGEHEGAGAEAETTTRGGQQGYEARLAPLNDSGVEGQAILSELGDTMRIQITARGLVPRREHPQRLHRLETDKPGECPTKAADEDSDGVVSLEEALPAYGPAALELKPFPTASRDGSVSFQGTFDLRPDLKPLSTRVIVLHGLDVRGEYEPSAPVACGRIG
jgi:hypothetical protein